MFDPFGPPYIGALLYQLVVLLFESPLFWRVSKEHGKKIT